MKVIVDAFGGDNAPLEILKGCELAVNEFGAELIVVGDENKIKECADSNCISMKNIAIHHAPSVIDMSDHPDAIIKDKKDCSMAEGFRLLASGEGDAFVSAGSTGAIVVGSTYIVKRIKGIKRAALAPVLPSDNGPYMIIDSGANTECRPEILAQFGILGSEYMKRFFNIESPKVGLLNIGTEDTKGGDLQKETFGILKNMPINFIGNVEARDVPFGVCNVLVADGFSGNIVLKLTEGVVSSLMGNIKEIMMKNTRTKLAAAVLKPGLHSLKKKMDYTEYGGAPLMGISKPVIKAHGSSNAKAFKNAIRQAINYAQGGAIEAITEYVATTRRQSRNESSEQE